MRDSVEAAVPWLETTLNHRISQVLTTRAFAGIQPGSPLAHPLLQAFLRKMNLDDHSIRLLHENDPCVDVEPDAA